MSAHDTPPMGHNGFTFETRDDLPDDVKKNFHFFKCDTDAVLRDVLKMPLADRGFYLTAILLMYRDLEGLPADDKAAAMRMHIDIRQYRPMKKKLMQPGLLHEKPSGRVSNARFEREITEYVMARRERSEIASARETAKKKAAAAPPAAPVPAQIPPGIPGGSSAVSPGVPAKILGDTSGDFSEKTNDFKGGGSKTWAEDEQRRPVSKSLEEREERKEKNLTPPIPPLPHLDLAPGEERVGGRVVVNCETVRHPGFTLSLPAITMQLVTANIGLSKREAEPIARDMAIAHALQWGAEIDAGRAVRSVVPDHPANFIRGAVVAQMRKGQMPAKQVGTLSTKGLSPEQAARVEAAVRRAKGGEHV